MVAIFTGNGLGLFGAAHAQSGQGGGGKLGQSRETHGVNVATGNLVMQALDERLVVNGLSAVALRTYNSRGQVSGAGQDGWMTGYERWIELVSGQLNAVGSVARLHMGDGETTDFVFDATRGYFSTRGDGAHDRLIWEDDAWCLQDGDSLNWESFQSSDANPSSRAVLRTFFKEGASYVVNYDALGRVSEVVSLVGHPNGDAIVYGYVGSTQQLASIGTRENGVLKTQVSYGYDGVGRLSWVQTDLTPDNAGDNGWSSVPGGNDGRLFRTSYTYASADAADLRIASVTASDGTTVSYTYEHDGAGGWRVRTVTEGTAADGSARTLTFVYGIGSTDVIDAAGGVWTYRYDAAKQLIETLAPAVNGMRAMTRYAYDADGNVVRITTTGFSTDSGSAGASATELQFRYDQRGNRIQQRDLMGNVVAWTYNASSRVTSETRYTVADIDGWDADDPNNWSSPSGAMTTRYVYENDWSNRLRFVIDGEGQVREMTYLGQGPGEGLIGSERRYLGDRYAGTVFTAQALTAWATDATAQRRANSSLTSHAYDARGRLSRTVEYAVVDAAGIGVMDSAATVTRYVHDAQGLLRQSIVSRGSGDRLTGAAAGSEVAEYAYDGMGRLLGVVLRDHASAAGDDATTVSTTYAYVDSANRISVTLDSGLVRTEARNAAGELLSVSESGQAGGVAVTRTTRNWYDANGRLVATQDAAGGRTYRFHDAAGRLVATVDPTGAVVQNVHDRLGRIERTIQHVTRLDTSAWLVGDAVAVATLVFAASAPPLTAGQAWVKTDDVSDRVSTLAYDAAGRIASRTDASGLVSTHTYDAASRLVMVTARDPGATGAAATRRTRMFYDAADRLVATLDAEGYLVEQIHDAGGRLVREVRYATRADTAYWITGTLAQLRPAAHPDDQTTRQFHDVRGRVIGTLDAEGFLTEYLYDEVGNQRVVKAHAKRLTGLSGSETLATLRVAAATAAPTEPFRLTRNTYNGLGQLVASLDHAGTVTRYTYDEAGRQVRTEAAQGTSEVREGRLRYDVFGNLVGELSGEGAALATPGMTEAQLDGLFAQYGVRHVYDLLGRRIETIDALGNKTWYFHDAAGRTTHVVRGVEDDAGVRNARGEVVETRYDTLGEVSEALAYSGRLTIAVPGDRASVKTAISTLIFVAAQDSREQFQYDRSGRLVRHTDAENHATTYAYNRFGDLTSAGKTLNGAASTTTYGYDRRGLRLTQTETAGSLTRTTSATYDAFGRLVRQYDGRGTQHDIVYDRLGRQVSTIIRDVSGQDLVRRAAYDAYGRVLSETDAAGRTTTYQYSDAARSTTVTSPEGVVFTHVRNRFGETVELHRPMPDGTTATVVSVYDRNGRLVQRTDAIGGVSTNAYDVRGHLVTTTDATGRQVAYAYDAAGRVLSRVEDPGAGHLNLTTRYAFDGQGRTLSVTDPSGRLTTMRYDRKGNLVESAVDPAGLNLRTTYAWDRDGRQLTVVEGAGTAAARQTTYAYDGLGRRTGEVVGTGAAAVTTQYSYDANDNLVSKTGAGGTVRYAYDAGNRLRFTVDGMGGLSEIRYDANGRVTQQRAYARAVSLASLGGAIPTEAQLAGFVVSQALRDDAQDLVQSTVHDRDGRARLVIDGAGGLTETVYDAAGRRVMEKRYATALALGAAQRDAIAAGATTVADVLAAAVTHADDSVSRFYHDAADRLVYSVDGMGGMTRIWYDAAGRITATRGFARPADVAGLATATIASLDAQLDWGAGFEGDIQVHDGAGRVRFLLGADGALLESRYDAAGNVVSSLRYMAPATSLQNALNNALYAGTAQVADFDAFVAANEAGAAAQHRIYDAAGRERLLVVRTSATQATVVERQYDAAGRLVGAYAFTRVLEVDAALSAALSQGSASEASLAAWLSSHRASAQLQRMVYDAAGRIVFVIDGAGAVVTTRYNALGAIASTRRHATAIALNLLGTTLDAAQVAAAVVESAQDQVDYDIHDSAARVVFRVRADGAIQEIRYDGIGRVRSTLAYAMPLPSATMALVSAGTATKEAFAAHVAAHEAGARAEGTHYDQAGRVRFQVVRSGAATAQVTETRYDAIGRVVARTRYGVDVAYALGTSTTAVAAAVASAIAGNPAASRTVRYFHDAANRERFAIDPSGALSEQRYDALGRVVSVRVYANPPSATTDAAAIAAWTTTQPTSAVRMIATAYDAAGRAIARTDALGQTETFQYDAAGNIVRHVDRAGAAWQYQYDLAGRRVAEISPQVNVSTPSGASVLRSIATRMEYDGVGNIVRRIEDADAAASRTTRYEYDNRGNTIRIVLPDPVTGAAPLAGAADTIEIGYDTLGNAVVQKDVLGHRSYKIYDSAGRVVYDVDQESHVTRHVYNAFGEEVRTVRHALALDTAAAAFGAAGWSPGMALSEALVAAGLTVDAADRGVDSSYDLLGRKVQVQQDAVTYHKADGSTAIGRPTVRSVYNAFGEIARTSVLLEGTPDAADAVWSDTWRYYDALGRETLTVDAEGYVNGQTWNGYGEIQSKVEYARRLAPATLSALTIATPPALPAAGDAVTGHDRRVDFLYDALGRTISQTVRQWSQSTSAVPGQMIDVATQFGYDAEGRVTSVVDAQGTTTTRYDAMGRVLSVQQPARATVVAGSDTLLSANIGNTLSSAALYEQRSPYTELSYDAFGNAVRVHRFANGKIGSAAAIVGAEDQVSTTEYDRRGRIVAENDLAAGSRVTRTYDAADRVISVRSTLRGGSAIDGSTATLESDITTTVTYDRAGRQLSSVTLRERFQIAGGVREWKGSFTDASEIVRYNAFGEVVAKDDRIAGAFAAGTPFVSYEYDKAGRATRTNAQGGAWVDQGYDLAGRIVRTRKSSYSLNAQGAQVVVDAVTLVRYDRLGRAIRQELPSNSDDLGQRPVLVREYDRWGNVVRQVDVRGYETLYRYNSQDKLVEEVRPEVKVVKADGTEVRQRPTLNWYYDAFGRLTESRDANGHSQRVAYDNVGRAIETVDALGKVTRMAYDLGDRERYVQDPLGRITWKSYDRLGRVNAQGDFTTGQATRQRNTLEIYSLQGGEQRWGVTNALGQSARYDYDGRGLLLGSRSAAGVVKTYAHDLQGRKTRETNGNPERWRYLLSLTDVNGTITGQGNGTWYYYDDPYGNYGYLDDPYNSGGGGYYVPEYYSGPGIRKDREGEYVFVDEQTWDYDVFGRLVDHNDLGGADYDYIYHAVTGQLIKTSRATSASMSVVLSDGYAGPDPNAPPEDETAGNPALASSLGLTGLGASERIQFYYASGLVKEIREGGNWTRYAYDAAGNRIMEETYTRDGKNNLVHLRTLSTYDSNGRLSMVRQVDVAAGVEIMTTRYSYDAAGNRRRVSVGNSGSGYAGNWSMTGYAGTPIQTNYSGSIAQFAPQTTFVASMTLADGSPLPAWLTFDPATGALTGTPPSGMTLTLRLTARSIDDQFTVVRDINVNILPSRPPTHVYTSTWPDTVNLMVPDPETLAYYQSAGITLWSFNVAEGFEDPEGGALSFEVDSYTSLPPGISFNAATGLLEGTPTQAGTFHFNVRAVDVHGLKSYFRSISFTITPGFVDPGDDPFLHPYAVSPQIEGGESARLAESSLQLIAIEDPIDDGGGGGGGGSGGGGGGTYTPVTPGASYVYATSGFKSFWFDYDAMNRVTVVNGKLENGAIVLGKVAGADFDVSYALDYDAAGREIRRRFLDAGVLKSEATTYNERGQRTVVYKPAPLGATPQIAEILSYDAAGRLISRVEPFETGHKYAGLARKQEVYVYDADGRQTDSTTSEGIDERYQISLFNYGYRHKIVSRNGTKNVYDLARDARLSTSKYFHYSDFTGQNSGVGAYTLTYTYQYDAREAYLEIRVNGSGTGHFQPASTLSAYDGWGRRVAVQDGKERLFAYDAAGNIIQRKDSTGSYPITRYALVNGQQVSAASSGYVDVVSNLTAYRNSEAGSSATTVLAGDTLRSIAQRVYGNDSLWYVLAAANAVDDGQALTAGTLLKVPEMQVNRNDATTFRPYNPAEVIGSTAPQLDWVPPPPKNSCNVLKIILTIVVVVIVAVATVYTAGALAPALGASVAGVTGTMATGAAVLGGAAGFTWGAVAVAAVAGAVGSAVGQVASMAFGLTDRFDWGGVAVGALTSVASMGVGSALSGGRAGAKAAAEAKAAADAAKGVKDASTAAAAFKFGTQWAKGAAQAVAGNIANYGANWVVNRIDPSRDRSGERFNWANLAASAASGAVSAELGAWLGSESGMSKWLAKAPLLKNSYVQTVLASTVTGFAGGVVQHHVGRLLGEDGKADYTRMLVDAFGNGLAEAAKQKITDLEVTLRAKRLARIDVVALEVLESAGYELVINEKGETKALVPRLDADGNVQLDDAGDPIMIESDDPIVFAQTVLDKAGPGKKGAAMLEEALGDQRIRRAIARHSQIDHDYRYAVIVENVTNAGFQSEGSDRNGKYILDVTYDTDKEGRQVYSFTQTYENGEKLTGSGLLGGGGTESQRSGTKSYLGDLLQKATSFAVDSASYIAEQADAHPYLTSLVISGLQAVASGGPLKTIGMRVIKEFAADQVGQAMDEYVRKPLVEAAGKLFTYMGLEGTAHMFATEGTGFAFDFLVGGAEDVIHSAKNIDNKLKLHRNDVLHVDGSAPAGGSQLLLPPARTARELRESAGRAVANGDLKPITGTWLRGSGGVAGKFPGQIAERLGGRQFGNFNEFRAAFWKEVANDPVLSKQFHKNDLKSMRSGYAPVMRDESGAPVLFTTKSGKQKTQPYVLHHVQPISQGGGVYDMANLQIMTPRFHNDVLSPDYHYKRKR